MHGGRKLRWVQEPRLGLDAVCALRVPGRAQGITARCHGSGWLLAHSFGRADPTLWHTLGSPPWPGCAVLQWGSRRSPPPLLRHPLPGTTTHAGQGDWGGGGAAASWAPCRPQRRPREPERNEVAGSQVPTAAPVQKIGPELAVVAAATDRVLQCGGGGSARPRCAQWDPRVGPGLAMELGGSSFCCPQQLHRGNAKRFP